MSVKDKAAATATAPSDAAGSTTDVSASDGPKCCHRRQTLEALHRSAIHQSLSTPTSRVAMARCRTSTLNDPSQAMEILRSLLQPAINAEVMRVMQGFVDDYFRPAAENARKNNGSAPGSSDRLVAEVCSRAMEQAKTAFLASATGKGIPAAVADPTAKTSELLKNGLVAVQQQQQSETKQALKRKRPQKKFASKKKKLALKSGSSVSRPQPPFPSSSSTTTPPSRPNTDLILVTKTGKPVRREGPKWEPKRLASDTLFILGSKANKALGFGQTRGRLYIKHPELLKYSGDQEDKEWLAKNQLMSTTGGKAYLMVLADILELARSPDYSAHPRQQPGELVGFTAPEFMVTKMRRFVSVVRTSPATRDADLVKQGERQIAQWEEERKKLVRRPATVAAAVNGTAHVKVEESIPAATSFTGGYASSAAVAKEEEDEKKQVEDILEEMKTETAVTAAGASAPGAENDEELGFLHGMNLNNLVREFEMEAAGGAEVSNQHLAAILSLADDDADEDVSAVVNNAGFSELAEEGEATLDASRAAEQGPSQGDGGRVEADKADPLESEGQKRPSEK